MKNAMIFLVLALVLAACSAQSTPVASPTSTRTAVPPSSTPKPTLSLTPTASTTPEPAPSSTPAFLFVFPSITPTPQGTPAAELDCQVVSQSVSNGTHFEPKERFDMGWKVTNTGTAGWYPGSVEFTFFGGDKMYQFPRTQLQTGVAPGDTVALVADMVAPKNPNKYTTFWGLRRGNDYFCRVSLSIYVP